ncbi:hypothetical protein PVAP13_4KG234500 [Panicum virgatum]|uniref:Uncharacterized protein n=1 Tax=Panicum virgatum TaxID=38727 RepID=A0A8T0TNH8_PANVG|nr:hypothetical protein PVAP13_4KG234500 [Panicum virgatum]
MEAPWASLSGQLGRLQPAGEACRPGRLLLCGCGSPAWASATPRARCPGAGVRSPGRAHGVRQGRTTGTVHGGIAVSALVKTMEVVYNAAAGGLSLTRRFRSRPRLPATAPPGGVPPDWARRLVVVLANCPRRTPPLRGRQRGSRVGRRDAGRASRRCCSPTSPWPTQK